MRNYILLIFAFISFLSACDPAMVFDQFEKTNNKSWDWKDIKRFEIDMQDSIGAYNIYANIRHTKEYPLSNLYLFINIIAPNEAEFRDTIELSVAKPNGQWLGSGFGDIKFVRKRFRTDVRFPQKGIYTIELEHGMRLKNIPVTDVGIRIEKFKSLN